VKSTPIRSLAFAVAVCLGLGVMPASAATTGTVRGQVVSQKDGTPVASATIALASATTSYRTTTNPRGYYAFVGVLPGTYHLSIEARGFSAYTSPPLQVVQDSTLVDDVQLSAAKLRTIGSVVATSASFPVQRHETRDVTVVGPLQIEQLGGLPAFENGGTILNSLPGVTPVGGGSSGSLAAFPTIRGGLENEAGFQLDGINILDPLTNQPINSLVLNGVQNLVLTAGPGDASQGGSGSGFVNVVTKTGTYPASGFLQMDLGGPAYEHNLKFEYGTATDDHRYSLFVSGRYDHDFGGCCSPPYGNVWGSTTGAYPDTNGQVSFTSTNDTVVNGLIHFGRDQANQLQLWGEWGSHSIVGGYGITPSQYPYTTNTPAYIGIYQQAPLLLSNGQLPALTAQQAQALMPFYPGQVLATQNIGGPPNEAATYNLMKIGWSRNVGAHSSLNVRLYRTQNSEVDESNDANDPLFGYGLPTVGFGDFYVTRATQNTGIASDIVLTSSDLNELTAGFDYRFSTVDLNGTLPSPSLFFAGPTIADFLPIDPLNALAPGTFYGQRYPAFTETITDPMHRSSLYFNDKWQVSNRVLVEPGLRWDQQSIPTAQGTLEGNQLEPRLAVVATLGNDRNTVLRAAYGHAATFAPLFQVETLYSPPSIYHDFPATMSICGGTAANFSAPCKDYYDELYNAWWKGYGVNPYSFTGPQKSDSYDFSYERQFNKISGIKVTAFQRRDYDVIASSQSVTFQQGVPVPGTSAITNDGLSQTFGLEFAGFRQLAPGLSVILNGTYLNQFVNFVSGNGFRPSVQPALLASGQTFHPSYFSPFTMAATFDYRTKDGWRIDPIVTYNRGYPVGTWGAPPVFLNGVPVNVPNTNLFNNYGNQYCYYVDPQVPGSPQNPNVVGSTGGGCSAAQNTSLTHPIAIWDIAISKYVARNVSLGFEVHNIFNNTSNYPYYNPGYINNGNGVSGPGSGNNPAYGYGLPSTVAQYPSTPYFSIPSGPGRQFTFYVRFGP